MAQQASTHRRCTNNMPLYLFTVLIFMGIYVSTAHYLPVEVVSVHRKCACALNSAVRVTQYEQIQVGSYLECFL